jgi:hypothetical protein
MEASMADSNYLNAVTVLQALGKIQWVDALNREGLYEDDKLLIQGILPMNVLEEKEFESLYIGVKLPNQSGDTIPAFNLPRSDTREATIAYYSHGQQRQYYRSGKWIVYLANLASDIREKQAETRTLNETPLGDEALFPDL